MRTAQINYKLDNLDFDGPLDLLLVLIEKNKYDIFDIPIFEITQQYAEYVQKMEEKNLDIISDFLLMSATLLDIKTRMLLPVEKNEQGEETDPREELVQRLLQYKKFKYLAGELSDEEQYATRYLYKEESIPEEVKEYTAPIDLDGLLSGVTVESLKKVFVDVMNRKEYRRDDTRADFGVIRKERVSLGRQIRSVLMYARRKRNFSFRQLLDGETDKTGVVVAFLAILELMKLGRLTARQDETGADIELSATEEIDSDDLNLEDIVDE